MGRRSKIAIFSPNAKDVQYVLTVWVVAIGNVISGSSEKSLCTSSNVSFAIFFLRALQGVLFLDFGANVMASIGGGANAQSELGDMDLPPISSTVVASSSADDNRVAMGGGACTFMSKRVGLCSGRSPPLWVLECSLVLEQLRSATCAPLARLSLPLCDPLCFVDGLGEPDGDVMHAFAFGVLDARVFCPTAFD